MKIPEYEVATVKLDKRDDGMRLDTRDDGVRASGLSLATLISYAYTTRPDLISGPDWVRTERFDVEAKVGESDVTAMKNLTSDQRRTMMRKVLEEHFNLKLHTETKTMPVYELVMKEPKLTPSGDDLAGSIRRLSSEVEAKNVPMSSIAAQLGFILQRTVIDKTGMHGKYSFDLKWAEHADEEGPSIFSAVQELGLKLQPANGPVETLTIDHAEMPTKN